MLNLYKLCFLSIHLINDLGFHIFIYNSVLLLTQEMNFQINLEIHYENM